MSATIYTICGRRVDRYAIDVIDCATTLHDQASGVSECSLGTCLVAEEMLKARLADWHPSDPRFTVYDDAVKALCTAALELYHGWLARLKLEPTGPDWICYEHAITSMSVDWG